MKNQNIVAMNISFLKTHQDSRILLSRTAEKPDNYNFKFQFQGKEFLSDSRRNYCEFGFSVQL